AHPDVPVRPDDEPPCDDGADDAADQADPALPDLERVEGPGEVRDVGDHPADAGPDDRADQGPEHDRAGEVLWVAPLARLVDEDPCAGEVADGDAHAVRRDGELRPDVDPVEDL